jgi:hypothetical protein
MKKNNRKTKASAIAVAILFLAMTAASTINVTALAIPHQKDMSYHYQILWTRIWQDGNLNTAGGKIATDSENNAIAYVSAQADDSCKLVKYDTDGNFVFQVDITTDNVTNVDALIYSEEEPLKGPFSEYFTKIPEMEENTDEMFLVEDIRTDPDDNIIIVSDYAYRDDEGIAHEFIYVFKYDSNGNEVWKNSYTCSLLGLEFVMGGCDNAVDSQGNIYVGVYTLVGTFILKLDENGDVVWFELTKDLPLIWAPMSVVLDSNEHPIISLLNCATNPETHDMMPIGLVKLNKINGDRMVNGEIEVPLRVTMFRDMALAVDTTDNSVFFGFGNYICKVSPTLDNIVWGKDYVYFINELLVDGEKLITCGGWCTVGDVINYYSAVYHKNTGALLLQMALGQILYSDDPFFQPYLNQLVGMTIDHQGKILYSGGEGGLVIIKVKIWKSGVLIPPVPL